MEYILITGSKGFIGKYLYNYIKNNYSQYEVLSFDIMDGYNLCNLHDIEFFFRNYNIKYVFHLAAFKSINESIDKSLLYYNNNLISTLNLLTIMEKYECFNLIFSSSGSIYGNLEKHPLSESDSFNCIQTNPYSKTKYYTENILEDLTKSSDKWNIVILRYFNPISIDNNFGLFNNILLSYMNNQTLQIYGKNYNTPDGTCIRDFIHIDDVILAHICVFEFIKKNKNIFKIYNIGTGKGYSILDIVNKFNNKLNNKLKYNFASNRKGDIPISYANVDLIYKELNWKSHKTINESIEEFVNYFNLKKKYYL